MRKITVVGAGFSGLTTAYFLTKQNFKVRVVDKADRPGGLIGGVEMVSDDREPDQFAETIRDAALALLEVEFADASARQASSRGEARCVHRAALGHRDTQAMHAAIELGHPRTRLTRSETTNTKTGT